VEPISADPRLTYVRPATRFPGGGPNLADLQQTSKRNGYRATEGDVDLSSNPGRNGVADFKINKAGMDKLQRDLEKQFSGGIEIPLDGSEEDAIRSVKDQLKEMGATPNDSEVEKLVRDARNG
jgi:hypothetical protein